LTVDTSPAGSLVALANKLAEAMQQLAAMSKTGKEGRREESKDKRTCGRDEG
jgi:hypothetical protein